MRYFIASLRGAESYYYKILSNYKKILRDFATPFFINDIAQKLRFMAEKEKRKGFWHRDEKSTNDSLIASKRYKFRKTPFNKNWHYERCPYALK